MTDSPIIPSPELVEQWRQEYTTNYDLARQAAQWGADQELKACCVLMDEWGLDGEDLVECRRPKPPSLKEQALAVIENSEICDHLSPEHAAILRRALEALDD